MPFFRMVTLPPVVWQGVSILISVFFFFNIYSLIFGFAGSLVAVCGLLIAGASLAAQGPHSRPTACGIAPDQGSNPCPLCWQAGSSPPDHQGRPGFLF